MANVNIQIKVDSGAWGSPGVSNVNIPLGATVQLKNETSATSYQWALVTQPAGLPLDTFTGAPPPGSSSDDPEPSFVITKEGSYLIRLIINDGLADEAQGTIICAVKELQTGNRIPAAQETTEVDPDEGWAVEAVSDILQRVTRLTDSGFFVAKAMEALAPGNVVHLSGIGTIATGLPGERSIPLVKIAHGGWLVDIDGPLGVMVGNTAGQSLEVTAGELCRVMIYGAIPAYALGAGGNVGDPVYVNNAGQLSLTAGDYVRQVGDVAAVVVAGSTYDIAISAGSNSIPRGNAGGDLADTYPNPTVSRVNGTLVTGQPSTAGQVLRATGASAAQWGALDLADGDAVTGILPVGFGGTGSNLADSLQAGGLPYVTDATSFDVIGPGQAGNLLFSGGAAAPTWGALNLATTDTDTLTGTLPVGKGGTGFDSYGEGSLLYGNAANELAQLSIGTGNSVLIKNSASNVPSWSVGALSVSHGGTGNSSFTQHAILLGNDTGVLNYTTVGTAGYLLKSNGGASAPTWLQTVPIANGGTGKTSLTPSGVLYGGSSSIGATAAGASGSILTANTSGTPTWKAAGSLGQTLTLTTSPVPGLLQLTWQDFDQYFTSNYATSTSTDATVYTTSSATMSTIATVTATMKQGIVMIFPVARDGATFSNTITTASNTASTTVNVRYNITNPDASISNYVYSFKSATAHNNNQVTGSITFPPLIFFSNTGGSYTVNLQASVTSGDTFQVSNLTLRVAQG